MSLPPILISTDFDGTIHDEFKDGHLAPEFFELLDKIRRQRPVKWVINTGRDWKSLAEALTEHHAPIWPDWVVLVEREIYRVRDKQIVSLESWNKACVDDHKRLFDRVQPLLVQVHKRFSDHGSIRINNLDPGSPFGLITGSEEESKELEEFLGQHFIEHPEITIVRNAVFFRFAHADYNKGICLNAILKEENMGKDQCFVAGDHLNDLPMLHSQYANFIACPSNAVEEVKAQVLQQGGYVAKLPIEHGVVEALNHYFIKDL